MSTGDARHIQLVCDISSRLAGAEPDYLGDEIGNALRRMSDFFQADDCMLFRVHEGSLQLMQSAAARPAVPSIAIAAQQLLPQLFRDALRNSRSKCLRLPEIPFGLNSPQHARFAHFGLAPLIAALVSTGPARGYLCAVMHIGSARAQLAQFRLLAELLASAASRMGLHAALQRSMREAAEARRIARIGRWEWDLQSGRILKMEGMESILGFKLHTYADFIGRIHPDDRGRVQDAIDSACAHGSGGPPVEYQMQTRRDDIRVITSCFSLVPSDGGPRMSGSFHDVTGARRGEHELQLLRSRHWHADRITRASVLVSSLAHELSQPLAAILANAQAGLRMILREPPDRQELGCLLQDIVGDSRRSAQVINALRCLIRGEGVPRAVIDAGDAARDVLTVMHGKLQEQQVQVELACDRDCLVLANKTQIEQVLLNLILNSVESMRGRSPEERRVRIGVSRVCRNEVQVSVSDSGTGIPDTQLATVFEPFWTTKSHGLGMGLELCRNIVTTHGGRIWAESNADRGATFTFRLPLAAAEIEGRADFSLQDR